MSFNNTKTPTLADMDRRKRRFVVPQVVGKRGALKYQLTPEQEMEFRRLYPKMFNSEVMAVFGFSHTTAHRIARQLGVQKDREAICKRHARQVKKICEKNGYYDSLRGQAPSQACRDAYQRKLAEGYNPMLHLKETNPRKFREVQRKKGETRKAIIQKARRRMDMGLPSNCGIHLPQFNYTRQQTCHRYNAVRKYGYILGDKGEHSGQRYTIFYDRHTVRNARFEANLEKDGFSVKELIYARKASGTTMDFQG